ncbi:tetratricopeptide repeat protein [Maribacter sp. PR1]|uniref:Tetratricopeptide repeat protein n=1 Tax=Maribacter cobaltidurans TaxID=1178778 RepID=A0ABU7ISH2_9FLAO|nr:MULTISPECIES: tetratricopeptide repeat protein [Maribacter]MDC6388389.1 tetratricopeptide repeat protein [Maribacter sp. PR1]MEE1975778.1 tetratricopeptide repeat protein [Maribacter cobaltidurans]
MSKNFKDSVDILCRLAELHMYNDSYKSISLAEKITNISSDHGYGDGLSDGYFLKANGYGALQKMDSALLYYQKSISTSKEFGIQRNLASAMANISVIEGQNGNYAKAIMLMDTVARMNLEENDYLNYGVTLNNRAYHFYEQGDFVNAMKGYKAALSVLDTIPRDIFRRGDIYRNIAKLNYQEEDFKDALRYFNESNAIYTEVNDFLFQSYVWSDKGNVYLAIKDYGEAIKSYNTSIRISEEHDFKESKSLALANLAIALREQGQYTQAILAFNESVKDLEHEESMANKIVHEYHLGYTYALMGQQENALDHLNRSVEWADSVGQSNELKNALDYRSKAYALWGMEKSALMDLLKMNVIKDSIFNAKKSRQIEQLQTLYETEKKEAEIALQEEEIKTLNAQSKADKLQKGIYAGGMASALAVSGLLFFGFRQRIKKNRIAREKQEAIYQQEIEHKQKELASQTLHLVQKNTFIQELMENLENIKNSPEKFKMEFRRIVMLLKKENASDKDWEVFKSYFADVHNDFDQKLKTIYPDISEKEIRLAAFLRMNLTTKEIAATLNVLPDSILKSKYRLKKKLGLGKDQDLNQFLNAL